MGQQTEDTPMNAIANRIHSQSAMQVTGGGPRKMAACADGGCEHAVYEACFHFPRFDIHVFWWLAGGAR